ncbi:MAG: hypothetical protein JSS46_10280 [Proteobacteria bacterium]|nr:hypothetical protein [Pseudomonadota bacterium]
MPHRFPDDPATVLHAALARVAAHHAARASDPALGRLRAAIGRWQARRLRRTYADLEAQPRYAAAIRFFETDLYGGADFAQRDADLARVVPVMKRLLPDAVIATVATAVELNALSLDLDAALGDVLAPERGAGSAAADAFTVPEYCAAYRAAGRYDDRVLQIRMAGDVGVALDRYVHKPMLRGALGLMHKPAHAAGLGALQDFLERGFDAFAQMGGAVEFLATIETRERDVHDAIVAGSDAPFPDPGVQGP